jgi:hypothetical protein
MTTNLTFRVELALASAALGLRERIFKNFIASGPLRGLAKQKLNQACQVL